MLSRMSITTQFALVFLVALALIGAASWLILDRIYLNQLKSQAETVADNVDAFGNWVAQYGRVWVKDDDQSYLGHLGLLQPEDTAGAPPKLTPVNFYSKNPALAQREFSEVVERSAVAVQVPADVAQRDESEQQARRVRGRRAARGSATAASRNTTS